MPSIIPESGTMDVTPNPESSDPSAYRTRNGCLPSRIPNLDKGSPLCPIPPNVKVHHHFNIIDQFKIKFKKRRRREKFLHPDTKAINIPLLSLYGYVGENRRVATLMEAEEEDPQPIPHGTPGVKIEPEPFVRQSSKPLPDHLARIRRLFLPICSCEVYDTRYENVYTHSIKRRLVEDLERFDHDRESSSATNLTADEIETRAKNVTVFSLYRISRRFANADNDQETFETFRCVFAHRQTRPYIWKCTHILHMSALIDQIASNNGDAT